MGNFTSGFPANEMSIIRTNDPFWNPHTTNAFRGQARRKESKRQISEEAQEHLLEFRQELARKQEMRRDLIAQKRREFEQLKQQLQQLREEKVMLERRMVHATNAPEGETHLMEELRRENAALRAQVERLELQAQQAQEVRDVNRELAIGMSQMQLQVQRLNSQMVSVEEERLEYVKHVAALKDVVKVSKDMLTIRESQIQGLKDKVQSIEQLLASREMKFMVEGLREEYEKQLRNIRNLRALYEERQRLDNVDKEHLQAQLADAKKRIEEEQRINGERLLRIEELEKDASAKYDEITNLQSSLGLAVAECKELQSEIAVINKLFSQILLGFNNSQDLDLDKLIKILEENHDLLTDIASNEESHSTAAALPKVLLNLINQINIENQSCDWPASDAAMGTEQLCQLNSPAEIVENLPKVWKVLIELLSHQSPPLSALNGAEADPCYNCVETPTGSTRKLSVSKTFIRLKDLIMEKKFLEREMYRLKHLNIHLEGRLQDQEKRLELVSCELKTTWHVVDKMQRQHKQLHTHEKILRYELHEKRKLLTELKEELEYCRDKWIQARTKNDSTQEQWKELRMEFSARKTQVDDLNLSAESGFSDDKDSSEDERGYESDDSEGIKKECDKMNSLSLKSEMDKPASQIVDANIEATTEIHSNANTAIPLPSTMSTSNSKVSHLTNPSSNAEFESNQHNSKPSPSSQNAVAGTSKSNNSDSPVLRNTEELFAAREERLRRLEEASNQLYQQVSQTNIRSADISSKLDSLHELYGNSNSESVEQSEASTEFVDVINDQNVHDHSD